MHLIYIYDARLMRSVRLNQKMLKNSRRVEESCIVGDNSEFITMSDLFPRPPSCVWQHNITVDWKKTLSVNMIQAAIMFPVHCV